MKSLDYGSLIMSIILSVLLFIKGQYISVWLCIGCIVWMSETIRLKNKYNDYGRNN